MISDPGYDDFSDDYDRVIYGGFREKIQDQIVFKALDDVIGEAPSRILDARNKCIF